MSNTILTPSLVVKEALMVLRNNLVAGQVVYRDHEIEWQRGVTKPGDTVKIRKPASFESKDFNAGTGIEIQNLTESSIDLVVEKYKDISLEVTSKEWTLSLNEFSERVIYPVMVAHAQAIDEYILSKYIQIPNFIGSAANEPWALADIAQPRMKLQKQKVPQDMRRFLICPETEAEFLTLDAIVNAEKSGTTQALRDANLGRLMGLDIYGTQNAPTHIPGTFAAFTDATVGNASAGATQVTITKAAGGTETLKAGDLFTIAGQTTQYVVTADATAAGGVITASIYPALSANVSGSPIATFAYKAGGYRNNLAFHRNAIAAVIVPLELPKGATQAEIINFEGIGVRVVYSYDSKYKKDVISFDFLMGAKVIQPELALRQVGAVAAKPS
jgi:hypothetical protein